MAGEANLSCIDKDHEEHGQKGDRRLRVDFKNEGHRDESEGDSGEWGKQGGPGKPTTKRIRDEGSQKFQKSAGPAGEDACGPDQVGIVGFLPKGAHDEKQVGNQADGVDSEGQGGDIVPTGALSETVGLPGIKKVSDEN